MSEAKGMWLELWVMIWVNGSHGLSWAGDGQKGW
jgi:hypothetical protein